MLLRWAVFFYFLTVPALAATPAGVAAAAIADGRPWTITFVARGRTTTLTLRPDGTGTMGLGRKSLSPTWRGTADGICMKVAADRPERCAALQAKDGGFDGLSGRRVVFELRR